jgi:hypothetical protein
MADDQTDVLLEEVLAPWTGDFDGIASGYIRVVCRTTPLFVAYDGERTVGLASSDPSVEKELKAAHRCRSRHHAGDIAAATRDDPALTKGRVECWTPI